MLTHGFCEQLIAYEFIIIVKSYCIAISDFQHIMTHKYRPTCVLISENHGLRTSEVRIIFSENSIVHVRLFNLSYQLVEPYIV